jgi:hypothetical protein
LGVWGGKPDPNTKFLISYPLRYPCFGERKEDMGMG